MANKKRETPSTSGSSSSQYWAEKSRENYNNIVEQRKEQGYADTRDYFTSDGFNIINVMTQIQQQKNNPQNTALNHALGLAKTKTAVNNNGTRKVGMYSNNGTAYTTFVDNRTPTQKINAFTSRTTKTANYNKYSDQVAKRMRASDIANGRVSVQGARLVETEIPSVGSNNRFDMQARAKDYYSNLPEDVRKQKEIDKLMENMPEGAFDRLREVESKSRNGWMTEDFIKDTLMNEFNMNDQDASEVARNYNVLSENANAKEEVRVDNIKQTTIEKEKGLKELLDEYNSASQEITGVQKAGLLGTQPNMITDRATSDAIARKNELREQIQSTYKLTDEQFDAYADYRKQITDKEFTENEMQKIADSMNTGNQRANRILYGVADALTTVPATALGMVENGMDAITGIEKNPYSMNNFLLNANDTIKATANEQLADKPIERMLYSGVLSGVESVENVYAMSTLFAGLGIAPTSSVGKKAMEVVSLLPFTSNAFTSAYREGLERGKSKDAATRDATISAGIEALTEVVSTGMMLDAMAGEGKQFVKDSLLNGLINLGMQSAAEGSEEAVGNILELVADEIVNADFSDYNMTIKRLMSRGISKEDAVKMANKEFFDELKEAAITGAIGGLVGGVGATTIGIVNTNNAVNEIENTGNASVMDDYTESLKKSDSKSTAAELSRKKSYSEMSRGEKGTIIESFERESTAEQKKVMHDSLVENGMSEKVADKVLKDMDNGKEIKKIQSSFKNEEDANAFDKLIDDFVSGNLDEKLTINNAIDDVQNSIAVKKMSDAFTKEEEEKVKQKINSKEYLEERVKYADSKARANATTKDGRSVVITGVGLQGSDTSAMKLVAETENGNELVEFGDLQFEDGNLANLYMSARTLDNVDLANVVLDNYRGGADVQTWVDTALTMYNQGRLGATSIEEILNGKGNSRLSYYFSQDKDFLKSAYELGQTEANVHTESVSKNKTREYAKSNDSENKVSDANKRINKKMKKLFEMVAKKYNINIDSTNFEDKDTQGRFMSAMAKILISENADNQYDTLIHELSEYAEAYNPERMQNTINEILKYLATSEGYGAEYLNNRINAYKETYDESFEEASHEYVFDFMAGIFSTKEGVKDFVGYVKNDADLNEMQKKGIIDTIADFLKQIADSISTYIKSHTDVSIGVLDGLRLNEKKAREFRQLMLNAWNESIEKRAETNKKAELKMNEVDEDGNLFTDGDARLSMKVYDERGRKLLSEWLDKMDVDAETKADIINAMDQARDYVKKAKESGKYLEFSEWQEADIIERDNGDGTKSPVASVKVNNSEYPLNIDFSTICKKRRTLNAVLNELVRNGDLDGVILGKADVNTINSIIKREGFEIACALCYVDALRYNIGSWADSFTSKYNNIVDSLVKGREGYNIDEYNFSNRKIDNPTESLIADVEDSNHSILNWETIENILQTSSSGSMEYKIANSIYNNPRMRRHLDSVDILSSVGHDGIRIGEPDLYVLVNNAGGQSKPRLAHDNIVYNNEILLDKSFNAEAARSVGGVRIQSFSDFMANMVFDYVQMIGDLSAKGLPAQAYTKEETFVKLFGLTGIKINMSIVPKAVDGLTDEQQRVLDRYRRWEDIDKKRVEVTPEERKAARLTDEEKSIIEYLKENAGLDINNVQDNDGYLIDDESFGGGAKTNKNGNVGYKLALEISSGKGDYEGYDKNCGLIVVGVSKKHIYKLMADSRVQQIIPYHKSSLNPVIAQLRNIDLYTDFASVQTTKDANGKALKFKDEFDFYEAYHRLGGDARATAEEYKNWCMDNGYTPKFSEFAWHENYYKLLVDFSTYDAEGNWTEQSAVKMKLPEKFNDYMEAELKKSEATRVRLDSRMEHIVNEIRDALSLNKDDAPSPDTEVNSKTLSDEVERLSKKVDSTDTPQALVYFAGAGTLEYGIGLKGAMAVEYDKKVADVHRANFGDNIFVGDVRDFDPSTMKNVMYFHASPVCKRYSNANGVTKENDTDITTAEATAKAIDTLKPRYVTIENVRGYRGSNAYNIIIDALHRNGYTFDDRIYRTTDFGGSTSRERLIIRATLEENLPNIEATSEGKSWYDVTEDLIDTLPKSYFPDWMAERLERSGIDVSNLDEPILILHGDPGKTLSWAKASEPSPTILAKDTDAKIVLTDGTILRATPRVLARIQGLGDDFTLHKNLTDSYKVVGNGIPTELSKAVIKPMADAAMNKRANNEVRDSKKVTDSEGSELTQEQVEFFKNSKARDSRGRLKKYYHGTNVGGFTVFNASGFHPTFLTDSKNAATTYTGMRLMKYNPKTGKSEYTQEFSDEVYEVYVNAENPLIIDAKGKAWNSYKPAGAKRYDSLSIEHDIDKGKYFAEWTNSKGNYVRKGFASEEDLSNYFGAEITSEYKKESRFRQGYYSFGDVVVSKDGEKLPSDTDEWAAYAIEKGYDSLIVNNVIDYGDGIRQVKDFENIAFSDLPAFQDIVVFDPSQIKRVDNKKPTANPDIRYSKKVVADMVGTRSEKYTKKQREIADLIESGLKGVKIKNIPTVAREIVKSVNSTSSSTELAENLQDLFDYIDNNPVSYAEMVNIARDMMKDVVDGATTTDEEEKARYKAFSDKVKGYKITLDAEQSKSVAKTYGSANTYRMGVFGTINIVKEGTADAVNLDDIWNELVEASDGYLDYGTRSVDMPGALAEAMYVMKPMPYSKYGMTRDDVAYKLALEMFSKVIDKADVKKSLNDEITEYDENIKADFEDAINEGMNNSEKSRKIAISNLNNAIADIKEQIDAYDKEGSHLEADELGLTLNMYQRRLTELKKQNYQKIVEVKARNYNSRTNAQKRRETSALKKKTLKYVKDLNNMLTHPGKQKSKHIPAMMQKSIVDLLKEIDISGGKSQALASYIERMSKEYKKLEGKPGGEMYIERLQNDIDTMKAIFNGKNINDLELDELQTVYDTLRAIKKVIIESNKLFANAISTNASDIRLKMIEDLQLGRREKTGISNKIDWYLTQHLNAERFFNRLGNYRDDSAAYSMYKEFDEGQLKMQMAARDFADIFRTVVEGIDNQKELIKFRSIKEDDLVDVGLKDVNGKPVMVTKAMRMEIYLLAQNDKSLAHLLGEGVNIPDLKLYEKGKISEAYSRGKIYRFVDAKELRAAIDGINQKDIDERMDKALEGKDKNKLTPKAIDKLYNKVKGELQYEAIKELKKEATTGLQNLTSGMSEWELKFLKAAEVFFHEESGKYMNETSRQLFDFDIAREENYYPIHVDSDSLDREFTKEPNSNNNTVKMGITNERVNSVKPLFIGDITNTVTKHIEDVSLYYGMAVPLRDMGLIMSGATYDEVTEKSLRLREFMSATDKQYIDNLMADINRNRGSKSVFKILGTVRGLFASAALTLNPVVVMKQAASYPTAAAVLGRNATLKALKDIPKGLRGKGIEELERINPLLYTRSLGAGTEEIYDIGKKNSVFLTTMNNNKLLAPLKIAINSIQFMDSATVRSLEYASMYYVDMNYKSLAKGTDAYWQKVSDVFTEVVEKTQPNYTTLQRASISRDPNEVVKFLNMYKTQPLQNFGIMYDAVGRLDARLRDYKADKSDVNKAEVNNAGKNFVRAVSSQVVAALVYASIDILGKALLDNFGKYRDDDDKVDKEEIGKKIGLTFTNTMISGILLASELENWVVSRFTGDNWYGIEVSFVETANSIMDDLGKVMDYGTSIRTSKTTEEKAKAIANLEKSMFALAKDMSSVFGIPFNNVYKVINMPYKYAMGITDSSDIITNAIGTPLKQNELIVDAYLNGDKEEYERLVDEQVGVKIDKALEDDPNDDYDEVDARESIESTTLNAIKNKFFEGELSESKVLDAIADINDVTKEKAEETLEDWKFNNDAKALTDIFDAQVKQKKSLANNSAIKSEADRLIKAYGNNDDAKDKVVGKLKSLTKDAYDNGRITYNQAYDYLVKELGEGREDNDGLDKAYYTLSGWDYNDEGNYDKFKEFDSAVAKGNNKVIERNIKDFKDHGVKTETIENRVKDIAKRNYLTGDMSYDSARSLILKYGGAEVKGQKKSPEYIISKWKYDSTHTEDDPEYSAYINLSNAISKGDATKVTSAVTTLINWGFSEDGIQSKIASYRREYLMAKDNGTLGNMYQTLVNGFVAAGLTESEARTKINKWKWKKGEKEEYTSK